MEGEIGGGGAAEEVEAEVVPRDGRVVQELLRSMGVAEYEPRVVQQLLEVWYRYAVDVLSDAHLYSEHAGKPAIDPDDVKLAIQSRVNFSFSQPPPREVILELARSRNKIPLPKSIAGPGIPLPPEQDTLISPNYQLLIPKKHFSSASAQATEGPEEDDDAANNPSPNSANPTATGTISPSTSLPSNPSQEQQQQPSQQPPQQQQQQQQMTPQRVSFPLAAGKHPRLFQIFGVRGISTEPVEAILHAWELGGAEAKDADGWRIILHASLWCIWTERNNRIFKGEFRGIPGVLSKIGRFSLLWIEHLGREKVKPSFKRAVQSLVGCELWGPEMGGSCWRYSISIVLFSFSFVVKVAFGPSFPL